MSKYLDEIREVKESLINNGYELLTLAKCFHSTGNDYMGGLLTDIGNELLKSYKQLSSAVGEEIRDRCDASVKSTK